MKIQLLSAMVRYGVKGCHLNGMQEVAGSSPARSTKPFWLMRFDSGGFLDLSEPLFYTGELS